MRRRSGLLIFFVFVTHVGIAQTNRVETFDRKAIVVATTALPNGQPY